MAKLLQIKTNVSKFQNYLPYLVKYLTEACQMFKAGQVAVCYEAWKEISNDGMILSYVLGTKIELTEEPLQNRLPAQLFTEKEHVIIENEILKLLKKGVIREAPNTTGQILSNIFLRPKKDGTYRLILNLKHFNHSVSHHHFKMDSLHTIMKLMTRNCYMASIDLKDAYYSVPVNVEHRKFLRFCWKKQVYEFTCLPNGLSCAPRIFTKLLKPPLSRLHQQGHISMAYLDDIYLQGQNFQECLVNVVDTIVLLSRLGFVIHPEKSCFIPSRSLTILGFVINSENMTIQLTNEKASALLHDCNALLNAKSSTIREVARVIGKIISTFPGVMHGALYYRSLERDKTLYLSKAKGNFEALMHLSEEAKHELFWWTQNITESYNVITHATPSHVITTDASKKGWGAEHNGTSSGGLWTPSECAQSINYLELLAILFGLQCFAKTKSDTHIRVMSDNTTAVHVLNNMGTSHSELLNTLNKEIWEWCIQRNVWISAAHIPGKQNLIADFESRRNAKESEWKLNEEVLRKALRELQYCPDIDLFASRINYQFDNYVSYRPDPKALAIDAFTLDWSGLKFYAFPPFSVIPAVLSKIYHERALGVCVLPDWPTQPWYAQALQMTKQPPLHLKASKTLLNLPSHPEETHPIWHKLSLIVCLLSGKD